MKINKRVVSAPVYTNEGAPARNISKLAQLKRSVLSCFLWESEFYSDGVEISERIKQLVHENKPQDVAALAIKARTEGNLRHVPLLLVRELARHPKKVDGLVSHTLASVIQRADELSEFVAIYWKDGKQPLSKQVKRGLAWALNRFNAYELAKYNRSSAAVSLRDVMFLTHPRPAKDEGVLSFAEATKYRGGTLRHEEGVGALWTQLASNTLPTPDTWETQLSGGADKKETFTRLINEGKLGYFALIRNLRNMDQSGVDRSIVDTAIRARKGGAEKVLPFRYIAAARHAPSHEPALDESMQKAIANLPKLKGTTLVVVDNSPSMYAPMSAKSDLHRVDAGCGVAIIARGVCENVRVFAFSNTVTEVPARQGMALKDAIQGTSSNGTYLGLTVEKMNAIPHDRLIVITDEESRDPVPNPVAKHAYMINVASSKNGVGYGPWTHIDGFSEGVIRFIVENETEEVADDEDIRKALYHNIPFLGG